MRWQFAPGSSVISWPMRWRQTAAKVFQKMLFGVRDHADSDVMRECLDALGQVWKKE